MQKCLLMQMSCSNASARKPPVSGPASCQGIPRAPYHGLLHSVFQKLSLRLTSVPMSKQAAGSVIQYHTCYSRRDLNSCIHFCLKAPSHHLLRAGQILALTRTVCSSFTSRCSIIPRAVTEPAMRKSPSSSFFMCMVEREKTSKDSGRQGSRVQSMPTALMASTFILLFCHD